MPRKQEYARLIDIAAHRYGVAPHVLAGLIDVESGFDPSAVSPAGAFGSTQFMPGTAKGYGVKRGSGHGALASQILGAAHYLHDLGYSRDRRRALASYNAGPGNPGAAGSYPEDVIDAARKFYKSGFFSGAGGGRSAASGQAGGVGVEAPSIERGQVQAGGAGVSAILAALSEDNRPSIPSSGVALPSFAARPALPRGYQPVETGGQPQPREDKSGALMAALAGLQDNMPPQTRVRPGSVTGAGHGLAYGPSGGKGQGELVGAPIDRQGVGTKPYVLKAVRQISGILGAPIQLGTGTRHSEYTTNGNISAHWDGRAIDLPATGKRLYATGRAALIAAGMDPKKARKAPAGLYNVNGWQIIFGTNSPALGGDHTDHVHVQPAH